MKRKPLSGGQKGEPKINQKQKKRQEHQSQVLCDLETKKMWDPNGLFNPKFCLSLENKDCKFDPCNPCVANKKVCGKQHTIMFHVDDSKCSHVHKKANDCSVEWLDTKRGDNEIGRVKAVRGKHHDCLGMKLDFGTKGKL